MKKVFHQMTPVLKVLKVSPQEITGGCMVVLERFVVLIYDRTSSLTKVNEARQKLFLKRSRSLDSIPPTRALLEQTLLCQPVLPSPSDWGGNSSTIHSHLSGQLYHKQRNLVTNLFDVDAESYVKDDASA